MVLLRDAWLHRHGCKDMNDGSCSSAIVQVGWPRRQSGCCGALQAATARAHPHMPRRRKSMKPASSLGRQRFTESGPAQSFVLRHDDGSTPRIVLGIRSSRSFFSCDRSLDRPGVDVEIEFLPDQLRQFARSHGLARNQLLLG